MSEIMVKDKIKDLFAIMNEEASVMIQNSYSAEKVTEDITSYIAGKLAAASRGYLSSIYTVLSDKTLNEPEFQNVGHANSFFKLDLDKKMVDAYKFDVKDLPRFNGGLDYKEINRAYASAVAGVGCAAVGGVLLGVLSGLVDIPVIGIIAGAVIAGLVGGGISYGAVVPNTNKTRLLASVKSFMDDLENEMYHWVDGVIAFYHSQVDELKKTF